MFILKKWTRLLSISISLYLFVLLIFPCPASLLSFSYVQNAAASATAGTQQPKAADRGAAEDTKVGKSAAEEVEKAFKIVKDPEMQSRLEEIGNRLVRATGDRRFEFHFKILEEKAGANAFALPGGFIYVGVSLMHRLRTEHELAGVLGHEIAHVVLRHGKKQQEQGAKYSWYALAALILTQDTRVAAISTLLLMDKLSTYSVEMEKEADRTAIGYVISAGYDPVGLLTFLEHLSKSATGLVDNMGVYQTHPYSDERIALVKQELKVRSIPLTWRRASGRFIVSYKGFADGGAGVLVDDKAVFYLADIDDQSAMQRAGKIAARLNEELDRSPQIRDVTVDIQGPKAIISLGGRELAILNQHDAILAGKDLKTIVDTVTTSLKDIIWRMILDRW
ncbi:MAG: M48 family metalloprotease [bacterium]|nr:M48 family metalloprotease [bacterium]MDD4152751.1 M48 family metalloprotease [bacterium]